MSGRKRSKKLSPLMTYVKEQWIGPLLGERPKGLRATEWLHFLFCLDTRHLIIVEVKRDVVLPAAVLSGGVHPLEGMPESDRRLRKGDVVAIRKDVTLGYYDVENGCSVWRIADEKWGSVKRAFDLPNEDWPANSSGHRDGSGSGVGGLS